MSRPQVAITLTTISARIRTVSTTIESLLQQDYSPFSVSLYISRDPFLLDQGVRELPEELLSLRERHESLFTIHEVFNIGSYRKLLPWLAGHQGHHGLVATADDDTVYPADWLGRLVAAFEKHRCIVCYRGHTMEVGKTNFAPYRRWMKSGLTQNPDIHNLPTGKDGVLYHTSYFHSNVLDAAAALEIAPTADDLWFKWHTAVNGVEAYCIYQNYGETSLPNVVAEQGVSLYDNYNKAGGNDQAIARLLEYGRTRLGFDLTTRSAAPQPARPRD